MTTKTDAARKCAEELPCPFCGAEFHGIFGPADSGPVKGQFWVECKCNCPACYGGETREECMALWNKRQHFPPSVSVSKLEEILVRCETYDAPTWITLSLKALIAEAK